MLYNKYAPETFDDVVGQDLTKVILKALVKEVDKINGLIFSGIHGVGKTLLARLFAKAINNIGPKDTITTDIWEIDAATYTGIDNIREVLKDIYYLPLQYKYKVYIIDEAHMLSRSAFDALLMTLQEPPKHVKFLFATTRPDKLPDTFISRCITLPLNSVTDNDIILNLRRVLKAENATLQEDVLATLAYAAEGSVRKSLSLLEIVLLTKSQLDNQEVLEYLKIFSETQCLEILKLILSGQSQVALQNWTSMKQKGYDEKTFFHKMAIVLTKLFTVKLGHTKNEEYNQILQTYNISFNVLISFWKVLIFHTEAIYSGGYSLVEATIIMLSLIKDKTDILDEIKKSFAI